jgi:uncharacterized protein (TIGR02001 family)
MKHTIFATLLAAAFAAPVMAQTAAPAAPEAAPEAAPASPPPLTANIGLFSTYRFRGIDQTYGKPALQGGVDYAHSSGFYVGNWNSNVQAGAGYPGGNLEMDFYGGYKHAFGDFGIDVGAYYYYYPGSDSAAGRIGAPANNRNGNVASGRVDNKEIYIGGSWKFLSLKYSHSVGDYFSTPNTKNSGYLDLSANYDLGDGWGVNGHVGHLNFKNMNNADYTDWKLGVTKDLSGWVIGASYIDTNAKGDCGKGEFYCFSNSGGTATKDAGKGTVVVSVSRTF